jgi:hypothetical protein
MPRPFSKTYVGQGFGPRARRWPSGRRFEPEKLLLPNESRPFLTGCAEPKLGPANLPVKCKPTHETEY